MRSHSSSSRRGAVLVITVLICAVAATIAVLLLRQSLQGTFTTNRSVSLEDAKSQLASLRANTESSLRSDPWLFLTTVLEGETPRTCLTTSPATQVAAGSAWTCGTTWEYSTPPETGTWIEITAPTASTPELQISYRHAEADFTQTVSYLPHQSAVFAAQSLTGDLDMGSLGDLASQQGGFLAAGTLTVDEGITLTASTSLASETAVAGDTGAAWVYTPTTTPPVSNLTNPTGTEPLAGTLDTLNATACPDDDPTDVSGSPSHLCIAPNKVVLLTDTTTVTLPADLAAAALVAEPGTGNLQLRYTTTEPDTAIADTAPVPDAQADAAGRVTAGTFAGQRSAWTVAGAIDVPASGIIATQTPLWLGLCDAADTTSGFMNTAAGTCEVTSLPDGTAIVAGTSTSTEDVWLSGPVAGNRLSVLTAGQLILPWFSSTLPTYNDSTVNSISLATLGGIETFPETEISSLTPLRIQGVLISADIQLTWGPFTTDSMYSPDNTLAEKPPSWFPGTQSWWQPVATSFS